MPPRSHEICSSWLESVASGLDSTLCDAACSDVEDANTNHWKALLQWGGSETEHLYVCLMRYLCGI